MTEYEIKTTVNVDIFTGVCIRIILFLIIWALAKYVIS